MEIKDRILIAEDDKSICRMLRTTLRANGYDVITAEDGKTALALISSHCPDVIILDLGLPDMDGSEIIKGVRAWSNVPIVVLSARSHENDKAQALDFGADDYLTKPYSTVELLARIRAAIRHTRTALDNAQIAQRGTYEVRDLVVDLNRHRVYLSGRDVSLTPNEFRIVALLAKHAGQVLTYHYILKELWGPVSSGDNKILRVHIANIRRKIEQNSADPVYLLTEVGVGYRMADE